MAVKILLEYAMFLDIAVCLACLLVMSRRRVISSFKMLAAFLVCEATATSILTTLIFFRKATGLDKEAAYHIYFFSYWLGYALESAILLGIIYGVFFMAMKPLQGLVKIGQLVFAWVAGVAIVLSIALGVGPNVGSGGWRACVAASFHIEQGVSILMLCLLLFVCFAIRPLGLTYGSRIFGISLGLGIHATVQMVQNAMSVVNQTRSVYSPLYLFSTVGTVLCLSVWLIYFVKPEPARKMILLPTTSPYFFWNAISEALGDEPGQVAIAGVTPAMFGASELEVFAGPIRSGASEAEAPRPAVSDSKLGSRRVTGDLVTS